MVEMASIGPPSLGTIRVVFATMDSLACNDKHAVSDRNADRTGEFRVLMVLETGRNCDQAHTNPAGTTIPGPLCC